jgi:hypothetical protein
MLGDGGPADRQTFGELVDSSWRAPEFLQQMAPVRIRNGIEWVRDRHERTLGEFPRSGKENCAVRNCTSRRSIGYTPPDMMLRSPSHTSFEPARKAIVYMKG